MSIQQIANSYANALGQRIKDVAVPELFNGNPHEANNKLALDYIVPVIFVVEWEYKFRAVCRVEYDHPVLGRTNKRIWTEGVYMVEDIVKMSPFDLEAKAQSHVSALRHNIERMDSPKILSIINGDYYGCHPEMKRIWL